MYSDNKSVFRATGRFKYTYDTDPADEGGNLGVAHPADSVVERVYKSVYSDAVSNYKAVEGVPSYAEEYLRELNDGDDEMATEEGTRNFFQFRCWKCDARGSLVLNGEEVCNTCYTPSTQSSSFFSSSRSPPRSVPNCFGTHLMEIDRGIDTIDSITYCIIIDCANIAHSYGVDRFDARGIHLAFSYFERTYCMSKLEVMGFVKAEVFKKRPRPGYNGSFRGNALMETEEVDYLSDLERSKKISSVPPGEDDDVYILTESKRREAFILSNDHFTDHQLRLLVGDNPCDSCHGDDDDKLGDFRRHVDHYRSGYTWVSGELRPYPASPMMQALRDIESSNCSCRRCVECRM